MSSGSADGRNGASIDPSAHVLSDVSADGVRQIVLNRPEKLNAITPDMWCALDRVFADADADADTRVVLLRGAGRAFTAGNDLHQRATKVTDVVADRNRILSKIDTCLRLWSMPKPVIVQIHGHCHGLGSLMGNCADLVYVSDDATIGWPVLPLGGGLISPSWSWLVGHRKAKELSFRVGSTMSGVEAHRLGFANDVFPAATVAEETLNIAREIARVPADLLAIKKQANNQVMERMGFSESMRMGAMFDALAHHGDGVTESRARIKELGIKGAQEWYRTGGGNQGS